MNHSIKLIDHIVAHCSESMALTQLGRRPVWARLCPGMNDIDFIRIGLLRCITRVNSGRDFLYATKDIHDEIIPLSTYFNSLKSVRRMHMLEAVEMQSYKLHCEKLASHDIDYLKHFPELNEYTVEAADGHFIDHACHTPKGENGKVYAAGFIYAMNLRNGLLRPLCCVTNGTQRHHEIPVLRSHIEAQKRETNRPNKHLYVYDKAVTDYAWWDNQKQYGNTMISVLKENSVAVFSESIPFDNNELNMGVEGYSLYENRGIKFSLVEYRDPETQVLHRFVTTLDTHVNPGTIAMLYFKRWTIEKAFNNGKSDFKERKAWSSNLNALKNQMRLTAMTYNLIRVHEEVTKKNEPDFIDPSDKKYTQALKKRQRIAIQLGQEINPLHFRPRITRISSRSIQAAQNAIMVGKSLAWFIGELVDRLIPRM